jgi:hypothetical protein
MYVPMDDKIIGGCTRFNTKAVGVNMERAMFTELYRYNNLESVTQIIASDLIGANFPVVLWPFLFLLLLIMTFLSINTKGQKFS